jgi:hypothetical protein
LVTDDKVIMPYFIGYSSGLCHYWNCRFPLGLLAILLAIVLGLIRRVKCWIYQARVSTDAGAKLPAGVLPHLPPPVPVKAKLRQFRCHGARLLLLELNPNPPADNLAQFPKARRFVVEHVQNFVRRKSAIEKSESEINPRQFVRSALCGPALEF